MVMIPKYDPGVRQQSIPGVGQSVPFGGPGVFFDRSAGIDNAQNARDAGLVAGAVSNVGSAFVSRLQREQSIADKTRAQDALIKFQQLVQDIQFGEDGWLKQQGEDVFKRQNNVPLTDDVQNKLMHAMVSLSSDLGNDMQRQFFESKAGEIMLRQRGMVMQHEAKQFQIYRQGVLKSGIANEINTVSLNYNDRDQISQSIANIIRYNVDLHGPVVGTAESETHTSMAMSKAIDNSLKQGDFKSAIKLFDGFEHIFKGDHKHNVASNIADSFAADLVQSNPTQLLQLLRSHNLDDVEARIVEIESGGQDFDKDGGPLISFDKLSKFKYQVTDKTAKDPGFGVRPARSVTPEEYNRVGQELLQVYRGRYNNDPHKIAAAYNAGAGAVDRAIASKGDDWVEAIPASTRDYLNKFDKARGLNVDEPVERSPLDFMSNEKRRTWTNAAISEINRSRKNYIPQLNSEINNQYVEVTRSGTNSEPLQYDKFQSAYGLDAPEQYDRYLYNLSFAQNFFSLKSVPNNEAMQLIANAEPISGDPNYAERAKQHDVMLKAFAAVDKQRRSDPLSWAAEHLPAASVGDLNINNKNGMMAEIGNRISILRFMQEDYGTGMDVFKPAELEAVQQAMHELTDNEFIDLFASIKEATGNDNSLYGETISRIRKDSPALSIAASIIGETSIVKGFWSSDKYDGTSVAKIIRRGDMLLNPDKYAREIRPSGVSFNLPADFNVEAMSKIGNVFDGDVESEQALLSAIRSYAAATNRDDLSNVGSSEIDIAIEAVAGNIIERGGRRVILPYGMDEDEFDNIAFNQYKSITGRDNVRAFRRLPLKGIGNGIYVVMYGEDFMTSNGNPIILDINNELLIQH